jgi:hypothetical protein
MVGRIIVITLIGLLLLFFFVPAVRNSGGRVPTTSEQITIRETKAGDPTQVTERSLELVTLLGFDAIRAILDPELVTAQQAEAWMEPGEQVLGVSIDGDHRAYPIKMLSRHEIVNDVVGGVSVAVTW